MEFRYVKAADDKSELKDDLKTQIYNVLLDRIVYLTYKPGQSLNEMEIAAEFGTSRTPVREALLKLQELKLINIVPRSGTFVVGIDYLEMRNLFVVKQTLEGLAAELAAERIGPNDLIYLAGLIDAIEETEKSNDVRRITEIDRLFHTRIYELTFNQPLIEMLESVSLRCARSWNYFSETFNQFQDSISNLKEVYDALEKKDKILAKAAMEKHVGDFREKITRFLT